MADATEQWLTHQAPGTSSPDLGQMLRDYRSQESLTQAALADLLGVDQTYVSKIERGHRVISNVGFLRRVCQVLDIPPGQLGLSNDPTQPPGRRTAPDVSHHDAVEVSQERWRSAKSAGVQDGGISTSTATTWHGLQSACIRATST
jgi:transcriptional regulator with XRE-family HTH domain